MRRTACGSALVWLFGAFCSVAAEVPASLALRQEYNAVAARIDSLVRAMEAQDADAINTAKLPDGRDAITLPDDVQIVAIFWADDEAKVWINEHFVGETRLTPVEVVVPSLYLKPDNVVRARGWDTDFVESGFLFGLYLRKGGVLHPVVVSDDDWSGTNGPVETITYAHAMPDVPRAEVIWGERTFGVVEMTRRFGAGDIASAGEAAGAAFSLPQRQEMSLHRFVAELTVLETERERLATALRNYAVDLPVPAYGGARARGAFTLGKAGPLEEHATQPVSEQVKAWSETLPAERKALLYPERRQLRGEGEATVAGDLTPTAGGAEDRKADYAPPSDRRNRQPGSEDGQPGATGEGGGVGEGEGVSAGGGGGFSGRSSRLGLLVPTVILAAYAVYATRTWRKLSEAN